VNGGTANEKGDCECGCGQPRITIWSVGCHICKRYSPNVFTGPHDWEKAMMMIILQTVERGWMVTSNKNSDKVLAYCPDCFSVKEGEL